MWLRLTVFLQKKNRDRLGETSDCSVVGESGLGAIEYDFLQGAEDTFVDRFPRRERRQLKRTMFGP